MPFAIEYFGSEPSNATRRNTTVVIFINSQAASACRAPSMLDRNPSAPIPLTSAWLQRMVDSATTAAAAGWAELEIDAPPGEHFIAARVREPRRKGQRVRWCARPLAVVCKERLRL